MAAPRPPRPCSRHRPVGARGAPTGSLHGSLHEPRRARDGRLGALVAAICPAGARGARSRGADRGHRAPGGQPHAREGARHRDPRRRHVALDAGEGCRADAARRRSGGATNVPRPGSPRPPGRSRGLRRGGPGGHAADEGPRVGRHGDHGHRPVPRLRRHGDRRCPADRGASRQAGHRSRTDGRGRHRGAGDLDVLDALARAGVDVRRREEPGVDPLPLRRRSRRVGFCSRSRARSSRRMRASRSTPSRSERREESSSAARSAAFRGTRRTAR